ncbi:MAG: potassium channel family protein [Muribaculaceae bacterium]|nr:potassium channel family protein [Muribaculaceae bacterium]
MTVFSRISGFFTPQRDDRMRDMTLAALRWVILALSVALIVFISIDIYDKIDFLANRFYMKFQFWVCMVFMADFFIELLLTPRGGRAGYIRHRWYYLLLSIPYLSIINHYDLHVNSDVLYCIRFVPLARGALALSIIYEYLTRNKIKSMLAIYITILIITVYFASLIFFEREQPVNVLVTSYWEALWWSGMQVTTLGCDIYPVTVIGKILSVVLSMMGMIMFPLFTVYLTDMIIRRHNQNAGLPASTGQTEP